MEDGNDGNDNENGVNLDEKYGILRDKHGRVLDHRDVVEKSGTALRVPDEDLEVHKAVVPHLNDNELFHYFLQLDKYMCTMRDANYDFAEYASTYDAALFLIYEARRRSPTLYDKLHPLNIIDHNGTSFFRMDTSKKSNLRSYAVRRTKKI